MNSRFTELGFYKSSSGSSYELSDVANGDIYIDDLLNKGHAFHREIVSDQEKCHKKLLLGCIPDLECFYLASQRDYFKSARYSSIFILMAIRWVIDSGFEVYISKNSRPYRLSFASPLLLSVHKVEVRTIPDGKVLLDKLLRKKDVVRDYKEVTRSDIRVIDSDILDRLVEAFKASGVPRVLLNSDVCALRIPHDQLDSAIKDLGISAGVNDVYDLTAGQLMSRTGFAVTEIIHKAHLSKIPQGADLQYLEEITIDQLTDNDQGLYALLVRATALRVIHINSGVLVSIKLLLRLNLQNLEEIYLGTNAPTASDIQHVVKNSPAINVIGFDGDELDLSDMPLSEAETRLALKGATKVTKLSVRYSQQFISLVKNERPQLLDRIEVLDFGNVPLSANDIATALSLSYFFGLKEIIFPQVDVISGNLLALPVSNFLF